VLPSLISLSVMPGPYFLAARAGRAGRPGVQTETAASTGWEGSAGVGYEDCSGYRFSVAPIAATELISKE